MMMLQHSDHRPHPKPGSESSTNEGDNDGVNISSLLLPHEGREIDERTWTQSRVVEGSLSKHNIASTRSANELVSRTTFDFGSRVGQHRQHVEHLSGHKLRDT